MARFAPHLAALASFAVYVATLAPGLPAGDSGELITVASTLGVAHPPGYPLFTLVGYAWVSLLPWGSVAWRMNLLSALCAALAVGLVVDTVRRLTRSTGSGLVSAGLLAFSPPFWKMAVVAEVFTMNALLAAGMLNAFSRVLERARLLEPEARPGAVANPRRKAQRGAAQASRTAVAPPPARSEASPATRRPAWEILVLALLTGLLVTHHHTLVLLAIPLDAVVLAMLLAPERPLRRLAPGFARPYAGQRSPTWQLAAAFLIGLLPLVAIPITAARHPLLSWDDVRDARDLLRLLLRVDYGTLRLDPISAGFKPDRSHALLYLETLFQVLGPAGLALLLPGVWALTRRPMLGLALAGFAVLQALFFTRIGFPTEPAVLRGVVERFYVLPNLVLAVVAGLGAAALLAALARAGARAQAVAAVALVAFAAGWPLVTSFARVSHRHNRFVEHLARDVLASTPAGAALFVQGDLFHNGLTYLTEVERLRPDVTVVDQELMTYGWYMRALRRRDPDLLPALGGGERLRLTDGAVLEGRVVEEDADSLLLYTTSAYHRVARSRIASRDTAPDLASLYAEKRRTFGSNSLAPPTDDRYSGLPGTENLRWIEHLRGRRPVAFVGLKDDSWTLRYEMIPTGYVLVPWPLGAAPPIRDRVVKALETLASAHLEDAFGDYDPWSFERPETARIRWMVTQAIVLLCQPDARGELEKHPGVDRLASFLARFEPIEPTPDPALLRAAGLLHAFHPRFLDKARAAALLERYLATGARGAEADEARGVLAGLAAR